MKGISNTYSHISYISIPPFNFRLRNHPKQGTILVSLENGIWLPVKETYQNQHQKTQTSTPPYSIYRSPFLLRVRGLGLPGAVAFSARSLPVDVSAHEAKTGRPKTRDSMCKPWTLDGRGHNFRAAGFPKKKNPRASRMETVIKYRVMKSTIFPIFPQLSGKISCAKWRHWWLWIS